MAHLGTLSVWLKVERKRVLGLESCDEYRERGMGKTYEKQRYADKREHGKQNAKKGTNRVRIEQDRLDS